MPDSQLAVQMYTLRDHAKTPEDLATTCRRLAEMGWSAVQMSAVWMEDFATVRQILDDAKLSCVATHVRPPDAAWNEPDRVADELKTLGCDLTAVGGFFPSGDDFNEANWSAWIEKFNDGVIKLKERGVRFGYHNHSHEWAKLGGKDDYESRTAMDLLVEKLHPDAWFELDTYWIAHAGGSPTAWLKKLAGRVPLIHVKDLAVTSEKEPYMAEVGVGNLDWPSILGAAKDAGVNTFCVEQDTTYRDPFDSLETSLKNLQAIGLS
jgi:sugar phosphate isomerase/epimerase